MSAKAVYTLTRAAGDFVNLTIESATATDGILTVVISGKNLEEGFFRSEISANVRLQISDGNNQISSEYMNMVPWTTDNIYIPDENFKTLLLATCDANNDGEISAEEAEEITSLDISATIPQITSLEGIEYFTNLETLDCSYNRIGSLNLTGNTKLKELLASSNLLESVALPSPITTLDLSNNKLSTVDVSKMKELTSLNVTNNKLGSLNLSQNKQLTEVLCLNNQLTSLDVSNLAKLAELNCSKNQISRLDLSENTNLTSLDASKNVLTFLDVTACGELMELSCSENQLTKLYVSGLSKIKTLDCSDNSLTEINLTGCETVTSLDCSNNALTSMNIVPIKALQSLDCSNNALTMLDVSNNASLVALDCSENPALLKLWVKDDAQQSAMNITKDEATTYYYNNGGLYIPDAALKSYLVNNYDDDGDEEISIAEADNITMINCSGKGVTDLTGVEACTNLVTLNCSNNSITTIKLPNLTKLKTVTCNGNPIEYINFDYCSVLTYLNLQGTPSSAISGTNITITNYTQATTLFFTAKFTPFTSFTVEDTPTLTSLEFYGEFTDITITDNSVLESLVFYTPAVNATLSGNSILKDIDVSALEMLETLDVQSCNLQSLDVTKNLALTSLNCSDNAFVSIDLSNNAELINLIGDNLGLTKINLSNNAKLAKYSFTDNPQLISIRVCPDFTMDNCLFSSVGNNPSLSIFNTIGQVFFYVGQYSTTFGSSGVVYEITNGGQNGKMVSVDETKTSWGLLYTETNAEDEEDGVNNVNTMKSGGYYDSSPAHVWCGVYGTGWYLPAYNELKAIYNNRTRINATLSSNEYNSLKGEYLSSTETNMRASTSYGDTVDVMSFSFSSNRGFYTSKGVDRNVRAILAF